MVTRERAMAMVHNALTRQAEENEQHMRAMERESAIVIKKAMTRFREERSENKALREHLGEQEATIARLASRVRTQDKAMASLRLEVKKKVVHFALRGNNKGGSSSSRPLVVADDAEYEEASSSSNEELLY